MSETAGAGDGANEAGVGRVNAFCVDEGEENGPSKESSLVKPSRLVPASQMRRAKLRASRLGKEGAVKLAQKEHWALVESSKRVVRCGSRTRC
jgi:hypothetical protein